MSAPATAMDALDIRDFLAARETVVLAIARAGSVYAIPVSFAFTDDGPAVYLRRGYGPDSQKRTFVEAGDEASFVVYDATDAGWQSVVAEGHLEPVSESQLDNTIEEAINGLDIPFFAIHRHPRGELEFTVVRLAVDKLSGIVEASHRR